MKVRLFLAGVKEKGFLDIPSPLGTMKAKGMEILACQTKHDFHSIYQVVGHRNEPLRMCKGCWAAFPQGPAGPLLCQALSFQLVGAGRAWEGLSGSSCITEGF